MSGNRDRDQDFNSLVDDALQELDSFVGPDKGGDLTREPPVNPEAQERAASSAGRQIVQNGEYAGISKDTNGLRVSTAKDPLALAALIVIFLVVYVR